MVEAQGSIGQRADGNVGTVATDSTVEQSPEVGALVKTNWKAALASSEGERKRRLTARGNRSR
jgi:hypothetical protein